MNFNWYNQRIIFLSSHRTRTYIGEIGRKRRPSVVIHIARATAKSDDAEEIPWTYLMKNLKFLCVRKIIL